MKKFFPAILFVGFLMAGCAEFGEVFGNKSIRTAEAPETVVASQTSKPQTGEPQAGGPQAGPIIAPLPLVPTAEKPIYHVVKKGENLSLIARKYQEKVPALAEKNQLNEPYRLNVGQKLIIKNEPAIATQAVALAPVELVKAATVIKPEEAPQQENPSLQEMVTKESLSKAEPKDISDSGFIWPVVGYVSSDYGNRRGRAHDGVDISAPSGTPVKAARAGKVIFADRLSGYGNLVIVKHDQNYFTAYAHLNSISTTKGKSVKQGELIGAVGRTGRASANHLHFELRHKTGSVNPLDHLPQNFVYAKEGVQNHD